jgi:hypothetical protein
MNRWTYAHLVVGLLLLVAPASALIPDQIDVSTSAAWLTAGSSEQAVITVQVLNNSAPLSGATVEFAVESRYGSISPVSTITDVSGTATADLLVGTASGNASITVRVTSPEGEVGETIVYQQIDHAAPYRIANIWHTSEIPVGETTPITIRMVDRYGNPVDGRRTAETVYFMVGSPSGTARFINGTDEITQAVDAAGNVTVLLQVDTLPGENVIWIDPPSPLPDCYRTITGLSNLEPCAINLAVRPSGAPPSVYADGTSRFYLTYTLLDRYGNPTGGRQLRVTTDIASETTILTTNANGQASISYGPRMMIGTVTLTATAVDNATVTVSQPLVFISNAPTTLLMTSSPEAMPSRDVPVWSPSTIRAKVVDRNGNPVPGETVEFTIDNVDVGVFDQVRAPELTAATATTNTYGVASVEFWPGEFTRDFKADNYSQTATGTCDVIAKWSNQTASVRLTYKNYPYLSVDTSISPEIVEVNETVDVTIRLTGDGWALLPDPIDVILCIDRAESMFKEDTDRMVTTRAAAKTFVSNLYNDRDRVGVLSFGLDETANFDSIKDNKVIGLDGVSSDEATYAGNHYPDLQTGKPYAAHATVDMPLTLDFAEEVNATLDHVTPSGGNPLRYAAYRAITELKNEGRPWTVKAAVILVDGDYDWYGDPLAAAGAYLDNKDPEQFGQRTNNWYPLDVPSAAEQNMSVYAINNDVRIYTISYSSDVSNDCNETMRIFAESTGGKNYRVLTADGLADVYTDIAGELRNEAGVNTTMDVAFTNVEVDSTPVSGDQVFDYVYLDGTSTRIYSFNDTSTIIPEYTRDDTDAWNANQTLHFDIGTVTLGQTWETTFRLKVLINGTIDVFGSGASITFNNADVLDLPHLYITAIGEQNSTVIARSLDVNSLQRTSSQPVYDILSVNWNLNYTGTEGVTQDVSYSNDDGFTWVWFNTRMGTNATTAMASSLDVRDLSPGEYRIRVYATAPDAPDDWEEISGIQIGNQTRNYIQIS